MKYSILHPGSNAVLHVTLQPGEKVMAESGSLMARSPDLRIIGKMWGGAFGAMKRMAFSFFISKGADTSLSVHLVQ